MSRSPGRMMLSASPGLGTEETLGTSPSGHSVGRLLLIYLASGYSL